MFEFLKIQYILGRINEEELRFLVGNVIDRQQLEEILQVGEKWKI